MQFCKLNLNLVKFYLPKHNIYLLKLTRIDSYYPKVIDFAEFKRKQVLLNHLHAFYRG